MSPLCVSKIHALFLFFCLNFIALIILFNLYNAILYSKHTQHPQFMLIHVLGKTFFVLLSYIYYLKQLTYSAVGSHVFLDSLSFTV